MEIAYYFATLPYLVANSFITDNKDKKGDFGPESCQKISLIMLGFALGRCFFTYIFAKIYPKLEKRGTLNLTGIICGLALLIQLLVGSLSRVRMRVNVCRRSTTLGGSLQRLCGAYKTHF